MYLYPIRTQCKCVGGVWLLKNIDGAFGAQVHRMHYSCVQMTHQWCYCWCYHCFWMKCKYNAVCCVLIILWLHFSSTLEHVFKVWWWCKLEMFVQIRTMNNSNIELHVQVRKYSWVHGYVFVSSACTCMLHVHNDSLCTGRCTCTCTCLYMHVHVYVTVVSYVICATFYYQSCIVLVLACPEIRLSNAESTLCTLYLHVHVCLVTSGFEWSV